MLRSSCLARMSLPKHTLFTFRTKVCTVRLSFLTTRYNFQAHASWLTGCKKPSCTKILLTVRTWPAAIMLNYSIENIRNDVRQKKNNKNKKIKKIKKYIYKALSIIYEKSQFDSLSRTHPCTTTSTYTAKVKLCMRRRAKSIQYASNMLNGEQKQ